MNYPRLIRPAAAWKALVIAAMLVPVACGESPSGPDGQDDAGSVDVPITESFEVQVAADPVVAEAMVEDASLAAVDAVASGGPWAEARELFRQARQAWRNGDTEKAAELAEQGRLVLAEALIDRRGQEGFDALLMRVDLLIDRLEDPAEKYARLGELRDRMIELRDEALVLEGDGDLVGASERLIFALAIADRMRHRFHDAVRNPEAFANAAVGIATAVFEEVVEQVGPEADTRPWHALAHARELLRRSNAALEAGAWHRAIVLARRSIGWSWFALRLHLA